MTKNEKLLFILLGIVVLLWATFRFIITPQYLKLEALTDEKIKYEENVSQMNEILRREDRIEKEWEDLFREKTILSNKYFSKIDQPQVIYLLNDLLDNEDLNVLDISFSKPKEEFIDGLNVNTMDVYIPYRANYEGLVNTIKAITLSPKKLLIRDLIMDKNEGEILSGNISLRIYGLDGIDEEYNELSHIATISNSEKANPFLPFDHYSSSEEENISTESSEDGVELDDGIEGNLVEEKYNREILEDFENGSFSFLPSNQYVEGSTYKSLYSKSNKYSIRFEYNILALEDENRAYMDLSNRNITIKYPPTTIGLWVYSYGYSPITLGLRMKGQVGEKIDIELSKGISWLGWNYIEASPPADLSLYPLDLDKVYIELEYNRNDWGVLLFDRIEANYPGGNSIMNESFTFYIVEKDDTLDKISMKFYGTTNKKNIIMKFNELNSDKDIREGKVLAIPK